MEWLRTFMSEAGKHTPLAPMEAKKDSSGFTNKAYLVKVALD